MRNRKTVFTVHYRINGQWTKARVMESDYEAAKALLVKMIPNATQVGMRPKRTAEVD